MDLEGAPWEIDLVIKYFWDRLPAKIFFSRLISHISILKALTSPAGKTFTLFCLLSLSLSLAFCNHLFSQ